MNRRKRDTINSYTNCQYNARLASEDEASGLADVVWLGDSRKVLRAFPKAPQKDLGYALYQVQLGQTPLDSKPMRTVGAGVYELREQDERAWYRVIYLKKVKNVVHVLHCFEKQTGRTEQRDINTAKERLKRLEEQQRQDQRIAKAKRHIADPSDEGKRP